MCWTADHPTEKGYYWLRYPGQIAPEIVDVWGDGEHFWQHSVSHPRTFGQVHPAAEWWGPIPFPG